MTVLFPILAGENRKEKFVNHHPDDRNNDDHKLFLGIDAGSSSLSLVIVNQAGKVVYSFYTFHKGQVEDCLRHALAGIATSEISGIGYTSSTPPVLKAGIKTDSRIAFISAAKHLHPDLKGLLIIGAEKFGLATFDNDGKYRNFRSNTSCAAGTGSFLDQQAARLNLQGISEFSETAFRNKGAFPKIASRCAVFAKTDLIHAQQEGYTLEEICDGLSFGLAKNIVDAVFFNLNCPEIVAAGGVALNKAVIKHIEKLSGISIIADEYAHLYGALGAALNATEMDSGFRYPPGNPADLVKSEEKEKRRCFPRLELKLSTYPDFNSLSNYTFHSSRHPNMQRVEVDLYELPHDRQTDAYLGIDIGSTSTKAVLTGMKNEVIAGFYTRTAGQPLYAVQIIFEAIRDLEKRHALSFSIAGAGTTGSGRSFIGKIIGADTIPDEITAHARAAFEIDPETDTIIEIGGQDSKFTTLKNGMVTFSVMNNVCAAGTGSFIEEQAKKLNCPLEELSERAEKVMSPMSSDRCTVFMERDLNHFLNDGYATDELLASVLHSIRDNYLSKVVGNRKTGSKIFFQGATAKNRALVAAFEQKLNKPVLVSKFCHLTGSLGVAIELRDLKITKSKFRGLDLYREEIPVRAETCVLCTNHCKLKVAEIGNETEAYGFLCGRDYHQKKFVKNRSAGFELIKKHREIFRFIPEGIKEGITIGIPAGLHLFEDLFFWQKFFDLLSFRIATSETYTSAVRDGKNLTGAEFCAPIAALHGHVNFLKDKADYIFLPVYLEENQDKKPGRQYCYYTQFVPPVISIQDYVEPAANIVSPIIKSFHGELSVQIQLTEMFRSMGFEKIDLLKVSQVYEMAKTANQAVRKQWESVFEADGLPVNDVFVMLLGRPYTVLSPFMNNHIPEIFEKKGVTAYYMDMFPETKPGIPKVEELLKVIKWKYASRIISSTEIALNTPGCYPVLITSFKCTPDAFVIEYFREILDHQGKPYLILQIDEHDSSVGYETRIEAAIRSFRNHFNHSPRNRPTGDNPPNTVPEGIPPTLSRDREGFLKSLMEEASNVLNSYKIDKERFKIVYQKEKSPSDENYGFITSSSDLKKKTLLLPCWDEPVGQLLEAVLIASGFDARLLANSDESIQYSLRQNTGQCLPLNIIVQNAIDYIREKNLDPAETVLWNAKSNISCNLSMFPHYMKKLLNECGNGMEKVSVYLGTIIFNDISLQTGINAYLAYLFGGNIRKIACRIRPYEKEKGITDQVQDEAYRIAREAFRSQSSKEAALSRIISLFESIGINQEVRPKVALFGDLYVRDNDLMNQNLVRFIEENGGEVITTPYSEYIKILVNPITQRSLREGSYFSYLKSTFLKSLIPLVEEKYNVYFNRLLKETTIAGNENYDDILRLYGINLLHRGESMENILKVHYLIENYPDLSLFVQTNPSYCCPSLVTEAMASKIEKITGVPVVTIEYDGTAGFKNDDIIPYLKYRRPVILGHKPVHQP